MAPKVWGRTILLAGVLGCCLLVSGTTSAGDEPAGGPDTPRPLAAAWREEPIPPPANGPALSLDYLVHMSRCDLERLYRQAPPGTVAEGYARGRAIRWPGTTLTAPMSRATRLLWRGKIFHNSEGRLVNQWCCGIRAITARVDYGPSWLDGQPSIIMDYSQTSHVWSNVRDEIREVAPGLFLGIMYHRKCPEPKFVMYFALETVPACRP